MGQKRIIADGVQYPSIKKASEEVGLTPSAVCKRLDDDVAFPDWQRLPSTPRKPKQAKQPEDFTRFMVTTTHGKHAMFKSACDVLGIDPEEWFSVAMKNAVLSALSALESNLITDVEGFDIEQMEQAVHLQWGKGSTRTLYPADVLF